MNNLSRVFIFKIITTIVAWCIPLILFPTSVLEFVGFPEQSTYIFVRLLGWAYLALCVGYYFGLKESLKRKRFMGPIWVGLVSNGGACLYLFYYGVIGTFSNWGVFMQFVVWGSFLATGLITIGLYIYGIRGDEPIVA